MKSQLNNLTSRIKTTNIFILNVILMNYQFEKMNFNKNIIILSLFFFLLSCKSNQKKEIYTSIQGETMGTYYNIKYKSDIDLKPQIDKELIRINDELSTYIPTSTISKFNKAEKGIKIDKSDLWKNIIKAKKINTYSNGFYDPTVMPLVNYWGFGYKGHKKIKSIDSVKINKLLESVGFEKIEMINIGTDSINLIKKTDGLQLDLSSIAKGYGVDMIGNLIKEKGIKDYLVEIGGEIVCSGLSPSDKNWIIGINTPEEKASINDLILKKQLYNKALATSGNYRNFYSVNGNKYSHTINPKTGFPERSNLLSSTIIANDCMTADALATACMAYGLENSIKMISQLDSIEACFIYLDDNKDMKVYMSDGFK